MTLTTIDSTPALVVIDLQNGTVSAHTDRRDHRSRRTGDPPGRRVPAVRPARGPGECHRASAGPHRGPRSRSGAELPSGWAGLVDELDVQPNAVTHRHSIEHIFPKLGETATTAEVIEKVEAAR
ncbi:hypothetical protein [Streptomyces shenzhenensis]|uniref:hypothetical protein n=1 Tax=Streptomyces shenzhenensis TaxID=943815 RepID=UPI00340C4ACE